MDDLKVIVITFLITILSNSISASSLDSQGYFKKIRDYGKHVCIFKFKCLLGAGANTRCK